MYKRQGANAAFSLGNRLHVHPHTQLDEYDYICRKHSLTPCGWLYFLCTWYCVMIVRFSFDECFFLCAYVQRPPRTLAFLLMSLLFPLLMSLLFPSCLPSFLTYLLFSLFPEYVPSFLPPFIYPLLPEELPSFLPNDIPYKKMPSFLPSFLPSSIHSFPHPSVDRPFGRAPHRRCPRTG